MSLTKRERKGVAQKEKKPRLTTRRKIELSLAGVAILFCFCWFYSVFVNLRDNLAKHGAEEVAKESKPKVNYFEIHSKAGEEAGVSMGQMASSKSYPRKEEIESMAKTMAVDLGSTPNDFIFVSAFHRGFARGYRIGRQARHER